MCLLLQILFNINGCCRPGEVEAFMGPSGSGKTTLLSIIGSRAQKAMKRSGEITFNGGQLTKRHKRQIGFVMQDDLLYESLTVYETLYYAAMLRLPRHMSEAAKKERVFTVIRALGLDSCKDTIVGGFFRKGISGGERKRASIGHELLINPSLVLLDEPTSGLDSTTAMHLLSTLRDLAKGGRAIVTTIHQPSSRLFQQLDKLLLLSKGHALYYGKASYVDQWFDQLGYTLPYKVNVADFILDIASSDVYTEDRNGEESRAYLIQLSEKYLEQHALDGYVPSTSNREVLSHKHETLQHEQCRVGARRGGRGVLNKLLVCVRTRRFQTLSTQDFCQFIIIGVLAGLFWLQVSLDTVSAATDTLGLLFFELLFLGFRQLFVALFVMPEERKMLLKERASGIGGCCCRLSAFFFARTGSDVPMDLSIPTIFLLLVYFIGGLRYSASAFFCNYFTVLLTMLVAQSWGLLLGTILMDPKTAQTIAAIIMLTMVLTAGYFVRSIPVWISWIKYLSFVFYGLGERRCAARCWWAGAAAPWQALPSVAVICHL
eukprot:jgi/Astpho2/1808/e_gw1.00037.4.1_t